MDNFIGLDLEKNRCDAFWIIHGTPRGQQANYSKQEPNWNGYIGPFHGDKYIQPWPSKPGEKFIKESLQGAVAYTFLRTGIYESTSDRPGSNYGAITIIMDDMDEKKLKKFEQELKKWFEENILKKYTHNYRDGWLKWDETAISLFSGNYDKQLKNSIQSLIKPYISNQNTVSNEKSSDVVKTDKLNAGTQKLKEEIAKLERQKQEIERQLAEKYAQLESV